MKTKPSVELAKLMIAFEKAFAVYFPDPAKGMAELASQILLEEGIRYLVSPFGSTAVDTPITCTKCRNTSHNPNDFKNRYCGFCDEFLGE